MQTFTLARTGSVPARFRGTLLGAGTNRNGRVAVAIYLTDRGGYVVHTKTTRETWVESFDTAPALVAGLHDDDGRLSSAESRALYNAAKTDAVVAAHCYEVVE